MTPKQTLEEMIGANIIFQLESNPKFKELPVFLKEHASTKADNPTLTEIYVQAVRVSLSGQSAERYAQILLAQFKSYGDQLAYVAPETVRDISREVAGSLIRSTSQKMAYTTSVETFETVAKRAGNIQLNRLVLEYLSSINPPLPKEIFERYKESGAAASTLYGEVIKVVQTPASMELCTGPYMFHAYDLSDGGKQYRNVLHSVKRGVTPKGYKLFPQEVKAEGIYPEDEKSSLKIGYFITKFEGGEVIDHGVPKDENGKVPEEYCYAIVMTNTVLSALCKTGKSNGMQDKTVELSPQIISLLNSYHAK